MKEKWPRILNIVSIILIIVCIVMIFSLKNEINELKRVINQNQSMLQSNISSISSSLRNELDQQANLINDSGWTVAAIDSENKTVDMDFYVVPKTYSPEKTKASIICNEDEYAMNLENGRYVARITLPLFEQTSVSYVNFMEGDTVRSQELTWYINPRHDVIPDVYMNHFGSMTQNYGKDTITRVYTGSVEIDYDHKLMGKSIENVKVAVAVDGKEIWSDNPKLEVVSTDTYSSHYRVPFEQTFEIKKGAALLVYAEATDQNGWVYRSVLEDATISDKGNALPNGSLTLESDIYDVDGNLIFKAE